MLKKMQGKANTKRIKVNDENAARQVGLGKSKTKDHKKDYRIYSINRPSWALIKFLDLESGCLFEVGAYLRLGAY